MKNVLITGITGFIGQNLVNHFRGNEGIKIFGFTRNEVQARSIRSSDNIVFLSELSAEQLDKYQIDIIVHLAGIAHDLSGDYAEEDYMKVNFGKTVQLYDEFLSSQASTFVFVSSIKSVVDHADEEINEEFTPNPTSHYGKSKLKAELYINEQRVDGKLNYILRPCMVHGPGNKGNLNLLYNFVKRGIPYPLGAFQNQRSFLSIENFCFVIESIISSKLHAGTYHLADSETLSTTELVKLIGECIGKDVRSFKLPKEMIYFLAKLGTWIHAPFNKSSLVKMTENLIVSNKKLLLNLGYGLPFSTREGLVKTIKSIDE